MRDFLERHEWIPKLFLLGLGARLLMGAEPGKPLDLPEPVYYPHIELASPSTNTDLEEVVEKVDILPSAIDEEVNKIYTKYTTRKKFIGGFEKRLDGLREYIPQFMETSKKYNIDPFYLVAKAMLESAGNPRAVSSKGAQGLMQVMPVTSTALGCGDQFDAAESIDCAGKWISTFGRKYAAKTGHDFQSRINQYHTSGGYLWGQNRVAHRLGGDKWLVFPGVVDRYACKTLAFARILAEQHL